MQNAECKVQNEERVGTEVKTDSFEIILNFEFCIRKTCTFSSVGTSPQAVPAANREAALKPTAEQLLRL